MALTYGSGESVVSTLSNINDGKYHHIAVAYDGEKSRYFLVDYNTETVDLGVTLDTLPTTESNYVGVYNNSSDLWIGEIGLIRVYDDYITSL